MVALYHVARNTGEVTTWADGRMEDMLNTLGEGKVYACGLTNAWMCKDGERNARFIKLEHVPKVVLLLQLLESP